MNLYTLFESRFPVDRHRVCLEGPHGRWTYADLSAITARYAHALVSVGAVPGDRVAVQVEKSADALALYLACLSAGLVYLPLNTSYQRGELAYFLADADPKVVVGRSGQSAMLSEIAPVDCVVHTLDDDGSGSLPNLARSKPTMFETVARAPGDLAAILYTSGTTGRSKGAMLTHRNLAANGMALVDAWSFTADDVLLHMLPIYHVHGLFVATHCVLLSGAKMWFEPKFDPARALTLLPRSTVMMGVPTYYTRLLIEPAFDAKVCKSIRLFVSGSAPLLPETFEAFHKRTGHIILERYGMTETGMNTSNPLEGPREAGTVGPPLKGVTVRVVGDDGHSLPNGTIGHLQVKGENVFAGYWRRPDKNAEEFTADGYFKTGDVAEICANGYVRLVGRAKDLIITGGLNVYPKEVEDRLDALPGVVESAVIGIPDIDFGEAVVAIVVSDRGVTLDAASIIAHLKLELAGFKVPKRVIVVNELPRNAMGKVQKNLLRERYS